MKSVRLLSVVLCAVCVLLGALFVTSTPDAAHAEKAAPLLPETIFADTVWTTPLDLSQLGEMGPARGKDGKRQQFTTVAFFVSGSFMEQTSIDCEPGDTLKDVVIARAGRWNISGHSAVMTYEKEWVAQSAECTAAPREGININFTGHSTRQTTGKATTKFAEVPKGKYAQAGMKLSLRTGETESELAMNTQSSAEAFLEDYLASDIPKGFLDHFGCKTTQDTLECPRKRAE